ncbi:hypothetical protein GPECTOR_46g293 [Gonium pectorale]|uniref:Uncharacterized protein n=1 Tax=Gonium pectorale TaxID=33097 RepID=A0A150G8R3_GONPE|nr:hypothetical protein GPECTOR_46g293 [Gonium pectorale]|eukprot:KXZ46224.1 hypothetical protein GPECTOR_46g293 [Gonium pectorale]
MSGTSGEPPEEAARRAYESALARVRGQDLLSKFVEEVASAATTFDPNAQPPEPGPRSLFDLPGQLELLGPDEVDGLLEELSSSDSPVAALEALSTDPHLLEDLCFGPCWPQLCGALGRLAGVAQQLGRTQPPSQQPASQGQGQGQGHDNQGNWESRRSAVEQGPAAGTATAPSVTAPAPAPALPRLSELLLALLGEAVSAVAPSSPAHAADLLAELAPRLGGSCGGGSGGAAVRVRLCPGPGPGAATALGLLAAAAASDPFVTAVSRLAHSLLSGLAAEFHTLSPGAADRAAAAVVELLTAGLASPGGGGDGGGLPKRTAGSWVGSVLGGAVGQASPAQAALGAEFEMDMTALDLLVLLDPELRWWQRLCAATHATQRLAAAAAAARLGEGLEATWERLAAAAAAGSGGSGAPTRLVACTALLAGLVRGNNLELLSCDPVPAEAGHGTGLYAAAVTATQQPQPQLMAARRRRRQRLQQMLGHLATCFCALAAGRARAVQQPPPPPQSQAESRSDESGGGRGGGASVFMLLAAEVLSAAAEHGMLLGGGEAAGGAGGGAPLTPLLGAVLQGDSEVRGAGGEDPASEAWLAAVARVLDAAAAVAPAATAAAGDVESAAHVPAAAADATAALLRRLTEYVHAYEGGGNSGGRGGAGGVRAPAGKVPAAAAGAAAGRVAAVAVPKAGPQPLPVWSRAALRLAQHRALSSLPPVAAALGALYDALCRSLQGRRPHPDVAAVAAAAAPEDDGAELLAAEAVLSYCGAADRASAATAPSPLPEQLRRPELLACAARRLCRMYDDVGATVGGHDGIVDCTLGGGARGFGGEACVRVAAKRRVAAGAGALARSCGEGRAALLAAGFSRRVLDDVMAVLRSGEYESPYLEPLPYADPLAGLTSVLADVVAWPGLMQQLSPPPAATTAAAAPATGRTRGAAGGGGGGGHRSSSNEAGGEERAAVLALLQELVAWLDPASCRAPRGLPHVDAAAVSLAALAAAVETDPRVAAAALCHPELQLRPSLQAMLAPEEVNGGGSATSGGPGSSGPGPTGDANRIGKGNGHNEGRAASSVAAIVAHSDLLLDRARALLGVVAH